LKVIPMDVYDKEGNLKMIEVTDTSGNHIIDVLWDDNDEQTNENRIAFREWAYDKLKQKDYEVNL